MGRLCAPGHTLSGGQRTDVESAREAHRGCLCPSLLGLSWVFWKVPRSVTPAAPSEKYVKCKSHSVVSDSLRPHGLHSPWDSPGIVGSRSLLQGIFPTQGSNPGLLHCRQILNQLSHQGSPSKLEWVAYPFCSRSSSPRNRTRVSCIAGGFFTSWATREARPWPSHLCPSEHISSMVWWEELARQLLRPLVPADRPLAGTLKPAAPWQGQGSRGRGKGAKKKSLPAPRLQNEARQPRQPRGLSPPGPRGGWDSQQKPGSNSVDARCLGSFTAVHTAVWKHITHHILTWRPPRPSTPTPPCTPWRNSHLCTRKH